MHYVIDEGNLSRPWRYAALFTKAYLRVFGDTVDPSESGVRPLSYEPVFDAFAPRCPLFLLPISLPIGLVLLPGLPAARCPSLVLLAWHARSLQRVRFAFPIFHQCYPLGRHIGSAILC